ncbi:MAG: hypothetical protein H6851_05100 [Geminicoccaceae bacterium]|nr:hypothetical protein [Geminicoccaceae bacterium]
MNVELDKARISAPIAALAAAGLMIGGWIARSEMAQATRETRLAAIEQAQQATAHELRALRPQDARIARLEEKIDAIGRDVRRLLDRRP